MNRKLLTIALVAGAMMAATPSRANAACSTGSLKVCASVNAFYGSNGHLYLRVWNLFGAVGQGVSHVMTFVGIGSPTWSGTASLVAARFNGSTITTWKQAKSINNNPVGAEMDFASQTKNGITNGLVGCGATIPPGLYISGCNPPNGPYLELEFTTSSQLDLANAVYGWHSQAVNGTQCSMWVDSNGQTVSDAGSGCITTSAVPEPVTMVLLGTGLAGMGGTGLIARRRRKVKEEI